MSEYREHVEVQVNSDLAARLRTDAERRGCTLQVLCSELLECYAAWLNRNDPKGKTVPESVAAERMTVIPRTLVPEEEPVPEIHPDRPRPFHLELVPNEGGDDE